MKCYIGHFNQFVDFKNGRKKKLDNLHKVGSVIRWVIILRGIKGSLDLINLEILDSLLYKLDTKEEPILELESIFL